MTTRSMLLSMFFLLLVCACDSNKATDAATDDSEATTDVQEGEAMNDPATKMAPDAAAVKTAIDNLKQKSESNDNLTVSVKGDGNSGDGTTATPRLIITIEAESDAHALEHAQELTDQGCICTSTGPGTIECDCGDD